MTRASSSEKHEMSLLQPGRAPLYMQDGPKPDPKPWLSCIWPSTFFLLPWRRWVPFVTQHLEQPNLLCHNCRQPYTHLLLQHIPAAEGRPQPLPVTVLSPTQLGDLKGKAACTAAPGSWLMHSREKVWLIQESLRKSGFKLVVNQNKNAAQRKFFKIHGKKY